MNTYGSTITEEKFELLRDYAENREAAVALHSVGTAASELRAEGLLDTSGITELGLSVLEKYKVDNAIIMAAGFSGRCMPLSSIMPKGLFQVKGEVLIEREIRQLKEAGIKDVILVAGFKSELFEYLQEKYGIRLLLNKDFDKYNNMSSLYVAQKYIKNTYILCSDNYYMDNVFHEYVYTPYYSCVYSDEYCDEYCITGVDEAGYITGIHRGGSHLWYNIGEAYFDRNFSKKFVQLMNQEWNCLGIRNMLMEDFQMTHIQELPLRIVKRPAGSILEFDTLDEFNAFDPQFADFMKRNLDESNEVIKLFSKYANIKSYSSVPTESSFVRLHLNENLFGPSPAWLDALQSIKREDISLYGLTREDELVKQLSSVLQISENNIFIHNGSAEVIKSIFSILLNEGDNILVPNPGWSYYKGVADVKFAKCIQYSVKGEGNSYEYDIDDIIKKAALYAPRIIVITTPHNPTGCLANYDDMEKVIYQNPNSVVLIDEAYWGYGDDDTNEFERNIIKKYNNVIISRTFSKFYGLAGIRIGYGVCSYPMRKIIGLDLPSFGECGLSRKLAVAALKDDTYYSEQKVKLVEVREWFIQELAKISGVKPFLSASNFVFVRLHDADAGKVQAYMEENNILVRLFADSDTLYLRITIGPKDLMERVVYQLKRVLADTVPM